jgi:uncharacterized protein YndB with AHSA1/START domain
MTIVTNAPVAPVFKTITVNVSVERAFDVFTAGFDSWWPRSHNICQSPMEKALIETFVGGRCYQRSIDGSECDWGRVIVWEPPHRFVLAWQLNADWQYDPDLAKTSEVEVRFTPELGGGTRVDLEHRHFERHGTRGIDIRTGVDSSGGWGSLLEMFRDVADRSGK